MRRIGRKTDRGIIPLSLPPAFFPSPTSGARKCRSAADEKRRGANEKGEPRVAHN